MPITTLLLFCACLLVSFLYSGIEAGLLSVDRIRLKSRVKQRDRAALRVDRLLARPGRLLAMVLLVTNFADVAALILISDALAVRYGERGIVAAGVLMLPVYLLGVQLLPKSLFRRFPYRALAALAGLLELTSKVLAPVLNAGSTLVHRYPAPVDDDDDDAPDNVAGEGDGGGARSRPKLRPFVARDEFRSLADEGERNGAVKPAEHRMIGHVLDFGALRVGDLLDPAPASLVAREGMRVADVLSFAREKNLGYLPVVKTQAGELIALVDVATALFDPNPQRDAATAYFRRAPMVVAPADAAARVLRRLRAARLNAAAVVEGSRLVGVIRTKNLLERLVRGGGA